MIDAAAGDSCETNLDGSCGWCMYDDEQRWPERCPPHEGSQHWMGCAPDQLRDPVLDGASEPAWEAVLADPLSDDEVHALAESLDALATMHRLNGDGHAVSLAAASRLMDLLGHEVVWMRSRSRVA